MGRQGRLESILCPVMLLWILKRKQSGEQMYLPIWQRIDSTEFYSNKLHHTIQLIQPSDTICIWCQNDFQSVELWKKGWAHLRNHWNPTAIGSCYPSVQYAMKTYGSIGCIDPHILDLGTSLEWSASPPGHFTPKEISPGTHWIGGWLDPRTGLDNVEKRKILTLPGPKLRSFGRLVLSQ
jgi:hypothetical protein